MWKNLNQHSSHQFIHFSKIGLNDEELNQIEILFKEIDNKINSITKLKSDIWSLGIIIYFMLNKEYPYNGRGEYQMLKEIESNKKLKVINDDKLNDLLSKMLKVEVNER